MLDELCRHEKRTALGVNILGDYEQDFALANQYPVEFLQIDSVAGHLAPKADADFARHLAELRAGNPVLVLGGVRFKYQPVNSGRSESEDLAIGAARCDGIVVTGDRTSLETEMSKIARFRRTLPDGYPVIVGAGMTDRNAAEQLRVADGAIVGSFLKDTYRDTGIVDAGHAQRFMSAVESVRSSV